MVGEEFLKSRNILANMLPQLRLSDPICLYYGYKIGSIIKISRTAWTVYRVVIA